VVAVLKLAGDLGIDERGAAVDIGGVGDDVGRRGGFVTRRLRDSGRELETVCRNIGTDGGTVGQCDYEDDAETPET
jgi:hypothetical protein